MLVCHCRRVCDRTIRTAVQEGARTTCEVGRTCGAGTGCGGCRPLIVEILEEETRETLHLPLLKSA